MSTWLTNLSKPYCGGPNYGEVRTMIFQLEGWELTARFPGGRVQFSEPIQPVNYSYSVPDWFENHAAQIGSIISVRVYTDSWAFVPSFKNRLFQAMTGSTDPIAEIYVAIDIMKLRGGKELDRKTPAALGEYVRWEYQDFLETLPVEGRGNGSNYIIRQREGQLLATKGERYRRNHDAALKSQLEPHPQQMEQREIEGRLWTHYTIGEHPRVPKSCYATPLDNEYYLHLRFDYRWYHDQEKYGEALTPEMQQIEQWMMPRLRLSEVNPALNAPADKTRLLPPGA